jgi:hypothetical protein
MAPVDLALHAGFGFKTDEGRLGVDAGSHAAEIVAHNGRAPIETPLLKTLANDDRRDCGVGF